MEGSEMSRFEAVEEYTKWICDNGKTNIFYTQ